MLFVAYFLLGPCSAHSSTLTMEAVRSSETLLIYSGQQQSHVPSDSTIYNHRCENLKSENIVLQYSNFTKNLAQTVVVCEQVVVHIFYSDATAL
jgi:hypothetical protein